MLVDIDIYKQWWQFFSNILDLIQDIPPLNYKCIEASLLIRCISEEIVNFDVMASQLTKYKEPQTSQHLLS